MISVKEATEKVLSFEVKQKVEKVKIIESLGKILAQDIVANEDIPLFTNSAMDGYAVKAFDIIGADKNYPVRLSLLDKELPAGQVADFILENGKAVPIMTGAPIPNGSDCIVPKEYAVKEDKNVLVFKEFKSGDNIRYKGEDIKAGDIVLRSMKKLYPADIGVMASLGFSEVLVYKPPKVGIIITGDEIIPIEEKLTIGKIRDSNSYSLASQVKESGAEFKLYGIVKDEMKLIKDKIIYALNECEILLLSGGVSLGDYDYTKSVLEDMGAQLIFWRVNQRPGKPIAFFIYKDKFIFGLPGNPVSVMVCFELYVRPLIKKFLGEKDLFRKKIIASPLETYIHPAGRTDFIRVKIEQKDNTYYFKKTGMQGSGILTSMAEADGLAILPEEASVIEKDFSVDVILLK